MPTYFSLNTINLNINHQFYLSILRVGSALASCFSCFCFCFCYLSGFEDQLSSSSSRMCLEPEQKCSSSSRIFSHKYPAVMPNVPRTTCWMITICKSLCVVSDEYLAVRCQMQVLFKACCTCKFSIGVHWKTYFNNMPLCNM